MCLKAWGGPVACSRCIGHLQWRDNFKALPLNLPSVPWDQQFLLLHRGTLRDHCSWYPWRYEGQHIRNLLIGKYETLLLFEFSVWLRISKYHSKSHW